MLDDFSCSDRDPKRAVVPKPKLGGAFYFEHDLRRIGAARHDEIELETRIGSTPNDVDTADDIRGARLCERRHARAPTGWIVADEIVRRRAHAIFAARSDARRARNRDRDRRCSFGPWRERCAFGCQKKNRVASSGGERNRSVPLSDVRFEESGQPRRARRERRHRAIDDLTRRRSLFREDREKRAQKEEESTQPHRPQITTIDRQSRAPTTLDRPFPTSPDVGTPLPLPRREPHVAMNMTLTARAGFRCVRADQ